jgi:DNA-binding MarR family transcriptional regulator
MTMHAENLAREIERLFTGLTSRRVRLSGDPSSLTATQRLALAIVVDEGPLRLGALAERMGTTDATATRTVDALEAAQLVRRAVDRADRRGVQVASTPAGPAMLDRRRRELVALLVEPLSRLSPDEQQRVVELLGELNATFSAREAESVTADA